MTENELADRLADAIVASAQAAHPGDPVLIAADALALVDLITGPQPGHYHDPSGRYDYCTDPRCPRVSVESPSMAPAELERRLASPGAKWDRR